MKKSVLAGLIATPAVLMACGNPAYLHTPYSTAELSRMDTSTLCGRFANNAGFDDYHSGLADYRKEVLKTNETNMLAELTRRGFTKRELSSIEKQTVYIGMRSAAAQCAWGAEKVGTSAGYGSYSEQWRGSGSHSYYFVNGRGKVEYISS